MILRQKEHDFPYSSKIMSKYQKLVKLFFLLFSSKSKRTSISKTRQSHNSWVSVCMNPSNIYQLTHSTPFPGSSVKSRTQNLTTKTDKQRNLKNKRGKKTKFSRFFHFQLITCSFEILIQYIRASIKLPFTFLSDI